MSESTLTPATEPEVRITRVFQAPRERVFAAWSDAASLKRWHAPNGCAITHCEIDFRVGGSVRYCISSPQGHECWTRGTYREIVIPERIVYSLALTDPEGNPVDPVAVLKAPDWPAETIISVTFAEVDGGTELTLHQTVSEALARRTGAYPSWLQMLNRLNTELGEI